jgi:hypothetical protein
VIFLSSGVQTDRPVRREIFTMSKSRKRAPKRSLTCRIVEMGFRRARSSIRKGVFASSISRDWGKLCDTKKPPAF